MAIDPVIRREAVDLVGYDWLVVVKFNLVAIGFWVPIAGSDDVRRQAQCCSQFFPCLARQH